jgi:two-component system NarL family response regulator
MITSMKEEPLRLAIVEDNTMLIENLRVLLGGEPGVESVQAFTSAEALLQAGPAMNLLLADIDLPGISGVELIGLVKAQQPGVNCLAYTVSEDSETVFAAIQAGACGYLLKSSTPRELIEALRELHAGGAPMTPSVARKVMLQFQQLTGPTPSDPGPGLSPREQEVLRGLKCGQTYKEIAARLHLATATVASHVKHIYEKVQAGGRDEALCKARQRGWL